MQMKILEYKVIPCISDELHLLISVKQARSALNKHSKT